MDPEVVNPSPNLPVVNPDARGPYVVLIRRSNSLEAKAAIWCSCSNARAAAEAALTLTSSDEDLDQRALAHLEGDERAELCERLTLTELPHAGAPEGIVVFDDDFNGQTLEVIDVAKLAEVSLPCRD